MCACVWVGGGTECCFMCVETAGCTVWTWVENSTDPLYHHVCWLKDSTAGHTVLSNHISGVTAAPAPTPPPPPPACDQGSAWCPPPYPPLAPPDKPPLRVCKTCKKPLFSWDRLPAFLHGCSAGPNLTDADLAVRTGDTQCAGALHTSVDGPPRAPNPS